VYKGSVNLKEIRRSRYTWRNNIKVDKVEDEHGVLEYILMRPIGSYKSRQLINKFNQFKKKVLTS
jgi:hypothetical protein